MIAETAVSISKVESHKIGLAGGGRALDIRFSGLSDMVRNVRDWVNTRRDLVVFDLNDGDWIGRKFADWSDVVTAVEGTWTVGVDRVEDLADEIARELPAPEVIRRQRVWNEFQGDEVCFDRYRAGDPYWRTTHRNRVSGPQVVTMFVAIGQNSWMNSDDIFWRGALAVALSRIIEDAGYRAEINSYGLCRGTYVEGDALDSLVTMPLKGAGDALDVSSLTNATSGWFFRTVYFGAWLAPSLRCDTALGSMRESTPETIQYLAGNARPWDVSKVYNKRAAVELGKQFLASLKKRS